jgi:tetraacyldisaccharide 4'-kinase
MREYFYNLITGERRVLLGPILRPFLLLASYLFFTCAKTRVFLYRYGILSSNKLPLPVISIGNITWGGTGKTPLVESVLQWLNDKGLQAVLLTRGYGNDEDLVLSSNMPYVRVLSGKNRLSNALAYLKRNKADVFVLDDGFQHLKIKRDIDIVTLNAQAPFGNKRLIPAGCLREPLNSLRRADMVVITKSDLTEERELLEIVSCVKNISGSIIICKSVHRPVCFYSSDSREKPLEYIKGEHVICVSALADNKSFVKTIKKIGAEIARSLYYVDHHRYTESDVKRIIEISEARQSKIVVTTEKDWVKLQFLAKSAISRGIEFLVLKIKLEVKEDEIFYRRLSRILHG